MLIGLKRRADCEEGAPSFMKDLHLYLLAVNGPEGRAVSGFQRFQQQDVSTEFYGPNYVMHRGTHAP